MTKLNSSRPVVRETAVCYRGRRPLVVELWPGFLVIRSKGKKSDTYTIDYQAIYETAAKIEARRNGRLR